MPNSDIELWPIVTSNPDCTHCGTVLRAITKWDDEIHLTCPCICHEHKKYLIQNPVKKKKRGK